jgi:hypothetical protein
MMSAGRLFLFFFIFMPQIPTPIVTVAPTWSPTSPIVTVAPYMMSAGRLFLFLYLSQWI